jgi:outer membrane protein assembly factor BamB
VALVAPDGKKLWTAKLGGTCHAPPVAADGLLAVGCDDGFLYGFRSK